MENTQLPVESTNKDDITTTYRRLYHCLQNPETNPCAATDAWNHLHKLFDLTLFNVLNSTTPTILSITRYNRTHLTHFLSANERNTLNLWAAYLARRSSGGDAELLLNRSHASHFLRLAAPAKFVDGAWLSGVHRVDTPSHLRPITRIAWQILSEELGDGELARNHVYVYSNLLKSLDIDIGEGDSSRFIDEAVNPGQDPRVWAAGVSQLALGMFPQELLPEILGFNLAYEAVTLDTLICAHELRELSLDPAYFNLHVTIDNSDSGHTAMALHAVIELMKTCKSIDEEDRVWRRVQAGYVLAQGLPVNPRRLSKAECEVLDMFSTKCGPATSAHLRCKGHIGGLKGMKLGDWMDPENWERRKYTFLEVLGLSNWVVPGKPEESRLIQEISWEGRMFGAFTIKETATLSTWISEIPTVVGDFEKTIERAKGSYTRFVQDPPILRSHDTYTGLIHHSTLEFDTRILPEIPEIPSEIPINIVPKNFGPCKLLFTATMPFEYYLASSAKSATLRGMAVLKILRILNGLAEVGDLIAGMDEVISPSGLGVMDLAQRLHKLQDQDEVMQLHLEKEWAWLKAISLAPDANFWFLVGVQYALIFLMHSPEAFGVIDEGVSTKMQEVSIRAKYELEVLGFRENEESKRGFWMTINTMVGEAS